MLGFVLTLLKHVYCGILMQSRRASNNYSVCVADVRTAQPQLRFLVALGFLIVIPAVLLESCAPPTAVATFAADAEKTADAGAALFVDIHASCVRRHMAAAPVSPIFFPAALHAASAGAPPEIPQCAAFKPEGEALVQESKVLSAYFRALQQLASFNSTSVSGAGGQTGFNIALANGLNMTQMDSISKLANVITEAFTESYRQRDLVKVLVEADSSIASVTQGFEDIVSKDYEGLLREEQQTLPAQYQAVADSKDPGTILLLNRAFSSDLNELRQRKAAAEAYVEALQQVREGHHTLAEMAKRLKPKQQGLALQRYTDRLEKLLPIEKPAVM